jgi:hypothetical protein
MNWNLRELRGRFSNTADWTLPKCACWMNVHRENGELARYFVWLEAFAEFDRDAD